MAASASGAVYSLETARTIKQNVNLREEPFLVANADDIVILSGWMFDTTAQTAPRIFARIDGARIPATRARRDDVAAAYGGNAVEAGFSVAVAIGAFAGNLLDVELIYESVDGGLQAFERRRVVVFQPGPVDRSDTIVVDEIQDLALQRPLRGDATFPIGITLGVQGWAHADDADGVRFDVAAIVAGGRSYQAVYRTRGGDRAERTGRLNIGYFAQIPSLRVGEGAHEIRARLFTETGASVESKRGLQVCFDPRQRSSGPPAP